MKAFYKWFAGVAAVVAATLFFARKLFKKKRSVVKAPDNKVASVVAEEIQEEFEGSIKKINEAVSSDDPADELAKLGNRRSRR